jgi:hypothetical protein
MRGASFWGAFLPHPGPSPGGGDCICKVRAIRGREVPCKLLSSKASAAELTSSPALLLKEEGDCNCSVRAILKMYQFLIVALVRDSILCDVEPDTLSNQSADLQVQSPLSIWREAGGEVNQFSSVAPRSQKPLDKPAYSSVSAQ